jgi:hypothetical protein
MALKAGLTLVVTLAVFALSACGLLRNPKTEKEVFDAGKAAVEAGRRAEATRAVRNPAQQGAASSSKRDEGHVAEAVEWLRDPAEKGGEQAIDYWTKQRRDDASNSAWSNLVTP